MSARHTAKRRTGHWIFNDSRELSRDTGRGARRHDFPYVDIDTAKSRVRKNRMPMDSRQVISEISLSLWHQMVSKSQMFLWPDLAQHSPYMKGRNQTLVSKKVGALRDLRNRIGHHHRIWASELERKFDDLATLAGYVDPDFGQWIKSESQASDSQSSSGS
ncbi:hypothetical protein [Glutamicibacter sp. NPDC087344]|uniref:hypothetical protein n=1 Tax=Glutamicibacter sp. NPDC087344 TaxID=3363994 RepID=UPI003826C09D